MTDSLRELLYPLGYLSALMFGARFFVQWIVSEKAKKSIVPKSFWWLSLIGNIALFVHAYIQLQFHVFLVQGGNTVISWRNLNLMGKRPIAFSSTVALLAGAAAFCFLAFPSGGEWFRIPSRIAVPSFWHIIGFIGILLFASRFWVQWWMAEQRQESFLGKPFWWISLIGNFMILAYFYTIQDPVNLIGPVFGLIPYIRNLMLLKKEAA